MHKLNQLAISIACSILFGGLVFILSVWNALTNFGQKLIDLFISVHPTVFAKVEGSFLKNIDFILVNTVYALIDGFILGLFFALLYNRLLLKFGSQEDGVGSEKEGETENS